MDNKFDLNKIQKNIAIYGAQMVGVSIYSAIKGLLPTFHVVNFIVSDSCGNPAEIDGVCVLSIDDFNDHNTQILIATPENHHAIISDILLKKGFRNFICINSEIEAQIMRAYYGRLNIFPSVSNLKKGNIKADICVYKSKFYKDRKLNMELPEKSWIQSIQAGAALTDIRVADICDNIGNNISEKNVNYSELSATYWIGKHAKTEYTGLFHYRRILDIEEEDLYKLANNDVDVILPYPTIHYPNINEHHKRYVKDSDWEAMKKALTELAPEYARAMTSIFEDKYFYNFNILIAKKDIFKKYCDWLFPILKRTEELSDPKGNERADRYIGYLGENLTTLFFLYHKDDFNIYHAGRKMLL